MFENSEEINPQNQSEKQMKFYYNREERIAAAPKIVQDYYSGKMKPVRGIKIFFQKQNIWIFFALILFVGSVWVYSGLNSSKAFGKIGDVNFELQAFSYEEEIFATIKAFRTKKTLEKYQNGGEKILPVKIDGVFFAIEANNQTADENFFSIIYENNEEFIRAKFADFDIIRIDAVLKIGEKEIRLSGAVKR